MQCSGEGPKVRKRRDPGRNQDGKVEVVVKGLIKYKQVANQYTLQAMSLATTSCLVLFPVTLLSVCGGICVGLGDKQQAGLTGEQEETGDWKDQGLELESGQMGSRVWTWIWTGFWSAPEFEVSTCTRVTVNKAGEGWILSCPAIQGDWGWVVLVTSA